MNRVIIAGCFGLIAAIFMSSAINLARPEPVQTRPIPIEF